MKTASSYVKMIFIVIISFIIPFVFYVQAAKLEQRDKKQDSLTQTLRDSLKNLQIENIRKALKDSFDIEIFNNYKVLSGKSSNNAPSSVGKPAIPIIVNNILPTSKDTTTPKGKNNVEKVYPVEKTETDNGDQNIRTIVNEYNNDIKRKVFGLDSLYSKYPSYNNDKKVSENIAARCIEIANQVKVDLSNLNELSILLSNNPRRKYTFHLDDAKFIEKLDYVSRNIKFSGNDMAIDIFLKNVIIYKNKELISY